VDYYVPLFSRYGTVPGTIKTVSEDAVGGTADMSSQQRSTDLPSEAQSAKEEELFYTARVTLDRTTVSIDGKPVNLTPGMAATVEIKTGKRKLIEYLLSPLIKMADEAARER